MSAAEKAVIILFAIGVALLISGVFLLGGPGWACIAASVSFFVSCFVIVRGIH